MLQLKLIDTAAGSKHLVDRYYVLKQVERYQQAKSQQERDEILYKIATSSKLFSVREVEQIRERGGRLFEEHRQRVLGYMETYFNLELGEN